MGDPVSLSTYLRRLFPKPRRRPRPPFDDPKRSGTTKRDTEDGGVPVDPNRPRGLSGGAAAALEFDD